MLTGYLLMTIGAALVIWGADVPWMPVFNEWQHGVRDIRDELLAGGSPMTNAARGIRTRALRGISGGLPGGRTWCAPMLRRAYERRMRAARIRDAGDYLLSAHDPFADRIVRASRSSSAGAQHHYPRGDQPPARPFV